MKLNPNALIVSYCLFSFTSYGNTYYVSPSGNDRNPGTSTSMPWRSISKVNSQNFNGDSILFLGGSTFNGSLNFNATDKGSSTNPIVISSYGTGKAIINSGTSYGLSIYNTAGFIIKNLIFAGVNRLKNNESGINIYLDIANKRLTSLKLDNLVVYGYHDAGIIIGSWAKSSGFNDISITNCDVHDNGLAGILTYAMEPYIHRNVYLGKNKVYNNSGISSQTTGSSGTGIVLGSVDVAVVEYCTSYNNGWLHSNRDGGPVGIWAYLSDSVTFQYNESHHNKTGNDKDGGGFDFDGGCTNSVMQYNYSHDNYGAGYLMVQYDGAPVMKNITIRYNISENDGRKGTQGSIHMWTPSNNVGIQTVKIYNNTVFVKPSNIATPKGFFISGGRISGVSVWNNIFQTTSAVPLLQIPSNTSSCQFLGNSYWSSGSTFKIIWGSTTYSSLAAWRTGTGNKQEYLNGTARGIQADAQFADTTLGVTFNDASKLTTLKRYKLKSTSGLINKGLDLKKQFGINVGSRDYWGNSLANKTTFHIGGFQGIPVNNTTSNIIVRTDEASNPAISMLQESPLKENNLQVISSLGNNNLKINFVLAERGKASIALYNLQGQLIKNIFFAEVNPGESKQINVQTDNLSNGIYLVSMYVNGAIITKKILLNR